ncbi:MAG: helix-turn-helix domain-containing protein [Patescibacteria group bacterium]
MDKLLLELTHLGLSEKEALVYLSAIELGPAPVQDISHKAKVNRATTYVMIESLSSRGLMSTFVKGKKRFYSAESPDRLLSILQVQKQELEVKQSELEKTLPMLLALFNAEGAKPQIRYIEGPEGLQTMRESFEKMEGEFIQIVCVDEAQTMKEMMQDHPRHAASLHEKKTPHRIIAVMDKKTHLDIPHVGVGEIRCVPLSEFPLHGEITVRGNHVYLFSYRSAILSIVVVSKEMADAVRALFDLAWKGAESYISVKR